MYNNNLTKFPTDKFIEKQSINGISMTSTNLAFKNSLSIRVLLHDIMGLYGPFGLPDLYYFFYRRQVFVIWIYIGLFWYLWPFFEQQADNKTVYMVFICAAGVTAFTDLRKPMCTENRSFVLKTVIVKLMFNRTTSKKNKHAIWSHCQLLCVFCFFAK